MDLLQEQAASLVERGVALGRSNHSMFHDLSALVLGGIEEPLPAGSPAPRLTEAWFC
jgi:hypothetical protein